MWYISAPKTTTVLCWDTKKGKLLRNHKEPAKESKQLYWFLNSIFLVKQREHYLSLARKIEFQKPGESLAKTGDRKYSPKTGGSLPKREGQNLRSLF